MQRLVMILWGLLVVLVVAVGYVRLAPSNPVDWHVPLTFDDNRDFKNGVRRTLASGPDGLARFDALVAATPRTRLLAGSVAEGGVTYVVRSRVIGFPDYVTAQQDGDTLRIYSRARFGRSDFGVNRDRVQAWLTALQL